jgi:hypothetical protein
MNAVPDAVGETVIDWLLAGDVSIRYLARRDLLGDDVTCH